jgi:Arc/MetJ-type ribon-helix-helix transcriptional regulator
MTITLTSEQQKWLEAEVAAGRFASVEDAVRLAVAELMTPIDTSDLSWAKPYIDEAYASLARGEGIPAEQVFAELDARLKQRGG